MLGFAGWYFIFGVAASYLRHVVASRFLIMDVGHGIKLRRGCFYLSFFFTLWYYLRYKTLIGQTIFLLRWLYKNTIQRCGFINVLLVNNDFQFTS